MKLCKKCNISKEKELFSKFNKEVHISTINVLDNLQPLCVFDNLSKSNKIEND